MYRTSVRTTGAAFAVLMMGGCYVYRPADVSEIAPESRVRLTVSARQAAELEPALRDLRRTLQATYLGEDDGELMFAVPLMAPAPGTRTRAVHNRVGVPRGEVTGLEIRQLSRWRTGLVGLAGLAALGYIGAETLGNAGDDDDKEDPGQNQVRVPLIRIPVGG